MKTPQQLYEDWERAHWAAQDIDLSGDGGHWRSMDASERNLLYWVLSSLMVAEGAHLDSVLRSRARAGRRGGGQLPRHTAR